MFQMTAIEALEDEIRQKARNFLALAESHDLPLRVTCTRRTLMEQARLYRQGRSLHEIHAKATELEHTWGRADLAHILMGVGPQYKPNIVTNAGPGQSLHNYGLALDVVPLVNGQPNWDDKSKAGLNRWGSIGRLGEHCGMEWGGRWHHPDRPHFQVNGSHWEKVIRTWKWTDDQRGH